MGCKQPMKKLICAIRDHIWKSDWDLSSDGLWAVAACLWWPATTCTRCGATNTQEPTVEKEYADKKGWLKGPNDRMTPEGARRERLKQEQRTRERVERAHNENLAKAVCESYGMSHR